MKKRRKTATCLNCGYPLKAEYEYCPKCGQENTDNQLSFGKLLKDFFANYFSLDSRFGRSFMPFFIKPGILTKEFMEGRRVKYANPIRLYLVISLVHFSLLSIYSGLQAPSESNGIFQDPSDSAQQQGIIQFGTSSKSDSLESDTDDFFINNRSVNLISEMADDYTIDEIMDSINVADRNYFEKTTLRQLIKLEKKGGTSLEAYILHNIPILMFFLLPIYALILKLFFQKRLYINHVVHSLHLHSFLFIVLSLFWLYSMITEPSGFVLFMTFSLPTVYILASFINTYNISKTKAFFRVLFSGTIYTFVLLIALLITFLVSFFTF